MAWPSTSYESCVANTTVVHAALLNAIQSAINGIINATYSLKSVEIDGTGGSVVVPVAGTLRVSAAGSGTTAPTTTVSAGRAYKAGVPVAWARIKSDGTLRRGYNVKDEPGALLGARHPAAGDFRVRFNIAIGDMDYTSVVATPKADGNYYSVSTATGSDGGFLYAQITIWKTESVTVDSDSGTAVNVSRAPALVDAEFSVLVFGE